MKNLKSFMKSFLLVLVVSGIVNAAEFVVRGIGSIGEQNHIPPTQRMIMAREAAIMDAQAKLVEQIVGASIKTEAQMQNKALVNELINRTSQGVLRGAQVISEKQLGTQAYEVNMVWRDDWELQERNRIETRQKAAQPAQNPGRMEVDYENHAMDISPQSPGRYVSQPAPSGQSAPVYQSAPAQSYVPAQSYAPAPVYQSAPAQSYAPAPVYQSAPAQSYAPAPVYQSAPIQEQGSDEEWPEWLLGPKPQNQTAAPQAAPVQASDIELQEKIEELERMNKLKELTIKSLEKKTKR